jgi:hypothetical protein
LFNRFGHASAIHKLAFAAALDQPCFIQNLEVMRDRGGGHFLHRDDLAAIHLFLRGDLFKDPEARLIGKGLRYFFDLGSIHKPTLSLAKQPASRLPGTLALSCKAELNATKYLDIHLNVEASKRPAAQAGFSLKRENPSKPKRQGG